MQLAKQSDNNNGIFLLMTQHFDYRPLNQGDNLF